MVDQVVFLSSSVTTQRLTDNLFDLSGNIGEQSLRIVFPIFAAIARAVPAYELHFRKSPDFWKVIDAELGL